jgi:signal transduction histidine kinase
MDIVQNSITAGADKIRILILADKDAEVLTITIEDNGKGIDDELLKKLEDPFYTTRTTRKVGLGIPLFKESAERAGGKLSIASEVGVKTIVSAQFEIAHIDRLPLGDIADTIVALIAGSSKVDFILELGNGKSQALFDTTEIKKVLNGVPIDNFEVLDWIKANIEEELKLIFGGVLNEITS